MTNDWGSTFEHTLANMPDSFPQPVWIMSEPSNPTEKTVRARLLEAALNGFLADDYHQVTTRRIAERAQTNVSMIHYYFGSKEGLYEAMIRETLAPLLEVLDGELLSSPAGFGDYLQLYYRTMTRQPEFPRLILKVLALNQGPGRRFVQQLLERGRARATRKVEALKAGGKIDPAVDPDMLRISFVSLAMTPLLLKPIFEEQTGLEMDAAYLERLAAFNGHLFESGLASLMERENKT